MLLEAAVIGRIEVNGCDPRIEQTLKVGRFEFSRVAAVETKVVRGRVLQIQVEFEIGAAGIAATRTGVNSLDGAMVPSEVIISGHNLDDGCPEV